MFTTPSGCNFKITTVRGIGERQNFTEGAHVKAWCGRKIGVGKMFRLKLNNMICKAKELFPVLEQDKACTPRNHHPQQTT
jgi:hypothetical protein